jgi:hypothetical protein
MSEAYIYFAAHFAEKPKILYVSLTKTPFCREFFVFLFCMKVLLDIKDNMAIHLFEVLKSLPYVKAQQISGEKAKLMANISEAVEELKLIRKGKLKGISAKDLLNEL